MIDRFVKRLATVADSGSMFDVDATMRVLGVGFQSRTGDGIPMPPDCRGDWRPRQVIRTTVFADDKSWYTHTHFADARWSAALPPGVDPPSIQYSVDHIIRCSDRFRMQNTTEADLKFTSLQVYACITKEDISHALPAAHPVGGGMTTSFIGYAGQTNDDIGTRLSFTFRSGSPCANLADLEQTQEGGMRFQRAAWNHQVCLAETEHDYCVAHGGTSISEADLRGLGNYVDAHCPTVNTMYLNEPRSGEIAPTAVLTRLTKSNPCGF
ncbi:hypothetical protein LFL96_07560 [Paraburkholderia sp. D15]|uniref:hypothetical protein n=1 Tax=Paraburkholderia sp. D15 TaxID=2880218 RepID=UPI002478DD16|nr:hypothetical protein [Paraburkholderia sp. D15]WGS51350.1 hypothetical protein LFL96_07560 [Paraburkholderia sp. D15]